MAIVEIILGEMTKTVCKKLSANLRTA